MGFDRSLLEPVMAQSDQGAVIIPFKQELHRRLARLHTLHSAPSEHDFPVGDHLKVGALDGNARWAGDAKYSAWSGVGLNELCKPSPHVHWVSQKGEYHLRGSVDANFEPNFGGILAHLILFLRSTVSAACFNRRNRERQKVSAYSTSSPKFSPLIA